MTVPSLAETPLRVTRMRRGSKLLLPILLGVLLGLLEIWGTVSTGYLSGWGDHFVLSPEGIKWAVPGAFENDWFMAAAPQPHWFFDLVTFAGQKLGMLSLMYVMYWAAGLLAFGAATSMLAYRFVPRAPWSMGFAITLLISITPWAIGGTGSPIIAQALPAVLSGNLIYVLLASILTERRGLVVVLAPIIAVIHVQQGSITLVLLLALLVVGTVRTRTIDWAMVTAFGLTAALVAFGLILRPVASNLQDFVRICDEIIPYHCAAHLWGAREVVSTFGLVALCVLSITLLPRSGRWIWTTTLGLAALGYTAGFVADLLQIPFLGVVAQGVNVYRLGAVLLPFAIWGAFAPVFTRTTGWRLIAVLCVWGAGWLAFLAAPGFPTALGPRLVLLGAALLVPFVTHLLVRRRSRSEEGRIGDLRLLLSVAGLAVFALSAVGGGMTLRSPNLTFIGDPDLRAWGQEVRDVVPQGDVIVASPRFDWVKLVSQRAVIADCKDVPYGGKPWEQWHERLEDLGGFEQCVGPLLYDELSAEELIEVADKYGSSFIVVNPARPETVIDLESRGWVHAVERVNSAGGELLQRPDRS